MDINTLFGNKKLYFCDDINDADLITHSGSFHADDIFSTILLMNVLDKEEFKIFRLNDFQASYNAFIYDIGSGKYDHHQVGGNGYRENGIKYASFGLIWKDYGRELLSKLNTKNIDLAFKMIDEKLVSGIDADDNGQLEASNNLNIEVLSISGIVALCNKNWNEEANQNDMFLDTIMLCNTIFKRMIMSVINKLEAKDMVEECINNSSNGLMILDKYMPWKEFLIKSDNPKAKDVLFVVFPNNRGEYSLSGVPKDLGTFELRKNLPSSWAGLRYEELEKVTGVEGSLFCHNALFLSTAHTKDAIMQLASIALNNKEE